MVVDEAFAAKLEEVIEIDEMPIHVPGGQGRQHQPSAVVQLPHLARPLLLHLVDVLLPHLVLAQPDERARGGRGQLLLEAAGSSKSLASSSHISEDACGSLW